MRRLRPTCWRPRTCKICLSKACFVPRPPLADTILFELGIGLLDVDDVSCDDLDLVHALWETARQQETCHTTDSSRLASAPFLTSQARYVNRRCHALPGQIRATWSRCGGGLSKAALGLVDSAPQHAQHTQPFRDGLMHKACCKATSQKWLRLAHSNRRLI